MNDVLGKFSELFSKEQLLFDEPMKNHTSFKVGGNADLLFLPKDLDEISKCINILKENNVPYFVMGNGSNLLVKDNGFKGVIIKLSKYLSSISFNDTTVTAQCGIMLSALSNACMNKNLSGLEFASGIPGTVGGAVFMNAGAYDGEIKKVLTSALVLTKDGETHTLSNEDLQFDYRKSILQKEDIILLTATFDLKEEDFDKIKCKVTDFNQRRISKQPLQFPSAGSTFRRPEGHFAGKLIMDSGLSGYSIGAAQVSEKHNGFIINTGNATAKDILDLVKYVQSSVMENFNVQLELEMRVIGE